MNPENASLKEKVTPDNIKSFRKELKLIKADLTDSDIRKVLKYLDANGVVDELLTDEIFGAFLIFATEIGFPSTIGSARMGLRSDEAETEKILSVLEQAKIIDVVEIPGGTIESFVNRDWKEDKEIKKNPEKEIKVYDYNQNFVNDLGNIFNKIGFKGEEKMNPVLKQMMEQSERVKALNENKPLVEAHDEELHDEDELGFFNHLDNAAIDKFSDGLLLVLGELEAEGKIPKFDNAKQAKAALMAAIRKLYQSRSSIGKMARKYQRFGAQRVLRKARREITRAQSR